MLEPMNATVVGAGGGVTVWADHQSASLVRQLAQGAAGIASDRIEVVTPYEYAQVHRANQALHQRPGLGLGAHSPRAAARSNNCFSA